MTKLYIAFSGKMHSGKTTCAHYLEGKRYGFTRLSIGAPLYDICSQHPKKIWNFSSITRTLFPDASNELLIEIQCAISDAFRKVPLATNKPRNIRLLQVIGELLRKYDVLVWAKYLCKTISENAYQRVVIDDLRHPADYEYLKEFGFKIVRVEVDPAIRERRAEMLNGYADPALLNAPQESTLDDAEFHARVHSTDDMRAMERELDIIMGVLFGGEKSV